LFIETIQKVKSTNKIPQLKSKLKCGQKTIKKISDLRKWQFFSLKTEKM
jgi:hypothetical protein